MSNQITMPQLLPVQPPAPLMDVYVNQVRLGATMSDFTIICGVTEDNGFGQAVNKDKVIVRLAPATAKLLYLNLEMAISAYEESVNEINLPRSLPEQLANIKKKISDLYVQQMNAENIVQQTSSVVPP